MKKIFITSFVLAALLCAAMASTALAADAPIEVGTGVLSGGSFYLRSEPSISASKLCVIPDGATISVLDDTPIMDGSIPYIKVFYGGYVGYIRSDYTSLFTYTLHDLDVSYVGIDGAPFDCETGGIKNASCRNCSYVGSETISAGSHQLAYEVTIGNCEKDSGSREYCTRCNWEHVEVTPAPGHDLEVAYGGLPGQEFNCENGGMKTSWCKRELCTYEHRELIPAGHDYYEVVRVEPTRHSSGKATMECTYCGNRQYITLPALPDYGLTDDFFLQVKHF